LWGHVARTLVLLAHTAAMSRLTSADRCYDIRQPLLLLGMWHARGLLAPKVATGRLTSADSYYYHQP
jgi:hypothetical protein